MRLGAGVAIGLLLALGTAGCGTPGTTDPVASASGASAAATSGAAPDGPVDADQAIRFARCMREHGIDMPDPEVGPGGQFSVTMRGGGDAQEMNAAQEACREFMPNGGAPPRPDPEQAAQQREMAECMRENGVPAFPDPDADGRLVLEAGEGLDPDSPAFRAAEEACARFGPPGGGGGGAVHEKSGG